MATQQQIARRFADQAGRPNARLLRATSGHVFVSPHDERTLCSYGTHFTLARIMLDEHGARAWWLLNGDTYSVSTSRHQRITREACQNSGLPIMILPFSALSQAGIDRDSIEPVAIDAEHYDAHTHHALTRDQIPQEHRYDARETPDGRWTWTTYRHWLGASVFRATYRTTERDGGQLVTVRRTAYFLSAFDEQERRPHYFLCELPRDAAPATVGEALHALKPAEVIEAEAAGLVCSRQGDVFAVPTTLTTRQLGRHGGKRVRGARVLDLSHKATEVVLIDDGATYARGMLHHSPGFGRRPEHQRQPIGDRRTWHLLVKNTVPVDERGDNRAWSMAGNVD